MKRILITGEWAFIGSNLGLRLIKCGYDVTILDSFLPQIHGRNPKKTSHVFKSIFNAGIKFIHGSVTSKKDWLKALAGQDAVIHLAALTGTGQSMYDIDKYSKVNVGGTALLLDILTNNKHTVKKYLLPHHEQFMAKENIVVKFTVKFFLWPDWIII